MGQARRSTIRSVPRKARERPRTDDKSEAASAPHRATAPAIPTVGYRPRDRETGSATGLDGSRFSP